MSNRSKIFVVVGTRPEAIKMAPVYRALSLHSKFEPILISTGQHAELLDQTLSIFGLKPDHNLAVMSASQTINQTASKIIEGMSNLLDQLYPVAVLVQGDTTTAFAAGLTAYYSKIPLGHVEAGLRTRDLENPFPEEANRQMVDRIAKWCFAPTELSKNNLLEERIAPEKIYVTGNTGIDGLLWILERTKLDLNRKPFVLFTIHRRESFGEPLQSITNGLLDFLEKTPSATAIWPVHPNPAVVKLAESVQFKTNRILIIGPQDYWSFAKLLAECRIILTDSGGVQEEAPSLGKKVLIARETTERPEAVLSGQNRLIGRDQKRVAKELTKAWHEQPYLGSIPAANPYGNGRSSLSITEILRHDLVPN